MKLIGKAGIENLQDIMLKILKSFLHPLKVGEEIAITCSSFDMKETEFFSITAVSGQELTLNQTIKFRHFGKDETTFSGQIF